MATRAAIIADYQQKWNAMAVTRASAVEAAAKRILANWDAYQAVEARTGVPAHFIGVLHMRECNNDMRGCLHNGERIIGTGRKTRLKPRGRGPFATWEEAAIDALKFDGFYNMADTSPGALCEAAERYNGLGYRNKGRPSPYVWAGCQWYKSGKYVSDGVYSAKVVDKQLGIAPAMKRVLELAPAAAPAPATRSLTDWVADKMGTSSAPVVIPAADPPKDEPPAAALSREQKRAIVESSEHLTLQDRYQKFLAIASGIGALLVAITQQIGALLSDPKALAVLVALLGIAGTTWWVLQHSKKRAFKQVTDGRYVPSKVIDGTAPPTSAGIMAFIERR